MLLPIHKYDIHIFLLSHQVRGSYFPPNKKPQPGEKRIHLCIEGPEKMMIEHARDEVKRQLEDAGGDVSYSK